MPDQQEIHKVSKEWICNVCATILGGIFSGWVRNRIEERNEAVKVKKNLDISMDPEVAAAFRSSTKVSRKYRLYRLLICLSTITSLQRRLGQPHASWQQEKEDQETDRGG